MFTSFLTNASEMPKAFDLLSAATEPSLPGREPVKVVIIGSPKGVNSTIYTLYTLGFAEVGEWSRLLPGPNPGEVMSILVRYLLIN